MDDQLARRSGRATGSRILKCAGFLILLISLLALSDTHSGSASEIPQAGGAVSQSFADASRHWNVPLPVLMAVGYVESRWEQRYGTPSTDFGYGVMHVVDRRDGTLDRAAQLTGLSPDAIRRFSEANIEAGAAVLSDISRKTFTQQLSHSDLAEWYAVVAAYSGASDPFVRDAYAQEVYRVIRTGARAHLQSGETVELLGSTVGNLPAALTAQPESDDYPGALWVAANSNNYTVGRPYPPLDTIVIHDTEGSYSSAISWFQNPSAGAAAHYVIRSSDGQITQMVREANTAYHAGNWDYNVRSIGIEHEGFMNQQGWYTEAMYQSSSALVRNIAERYGIKKDRAHIIGHYQVPNQSHVDPGQYWNWTYYMSLVRHDSERAALVDNSDSGFGATPPQIDPQHYWWTYSGGYSGSNTYATTSVTYQSSSINSGMWSTLLANSGYYDVYAFVPYVDNNTPDTSSAKYHVFASNGEQVQTVSQKAITDVGSGSWANIGKFYFSGGQQARVSLSDWTGETGKNVWFDAVMWIPSQGSQPPPTPVATSTSAPANTPTRIVSPTPVATWTPGACGMRFSDMPNSHWAYSYVSYLFCRNVVSGYGDGTFRPNSGSTRGQFSKMLVLALDWVPYNPVQPTFIDVAPGSTFYGYIEAAHLHGVIDGYSDGRFRPNNPLTRGQVAKMLVLGRGWALWNPITPTFSDVPTTHWAFSYIETAVLRGVVEGFADGMFRPDLPVNRAQLSKMVALTAQSFRTEATPQRRPTRIPPSVPTVPPKEIPAP